MPGSDVDLLVVLRESELSFLKRIPQYTPGLNGLSVDVLPYTEREVHEMRAAGHGLLRTALAEGVWLVGPPLALA